VDSGRAGGGTPRWSFDLGERANRRTLDRSSPRCRYLPVASNAGKSTAKLNSQLRGHAKRQDTGRPDY
jgi:hypothetical protein